LHQAFEQTPKDRIHNPSISNIRHPVVTIDYFALFGEEWPLKRQKFSHGCFKKIGILGI